MMLPSISVVCCGSLLLGIEGTEMVITPIVIFPRLPSRAACSHTQETGFGTRTLRTTGSAFFSHYIYIVARIVPAAASLLHHWCEYTHSLRSSHPNLCSQRGSYLCMVLRLIQHLLRQQLNLLLELLVPLELLQLLELLVVLALLKPVLLLLVLELALLALLELRRSCW
jgi:hypothetical protein